jgi:hypothetical protein
MKHMRPVNRKAARIEKEGASITGDVLALQDPPPRPCGSVAART